jgi:hypothetical protein
MWFGENEKRARNSEGLNKPMEKDMIRDDHGHAPLHNSLENLLDHPAKHNNYAVSKVNAYPY